MTTVKFSVNGSEVYGFTVSGHSTNNCGDENGRLVCSAVSSAAYMAANTITEVVKAKAQVEVKDAYMSLKLTTESKEAGVILKGFMLHMQQLAEQYSNNIKVYSEV